MGGVFVAVMLGGKVGTTNGAPQNPNESPGTRRDKARVLTDRGNLETKREGNDEPHMEMVDCDGVLLAGIAAWESMPVEFIRSFPGG
jgi:hypothetical protein